MGMLGRGFHELFRLGLFYFVGTNFRTDARKFATNLGADINPPVHEVFLPGSKGRGWRGSVPVGGKRDLCFIFLSLLNSRGRNPMKI